MTSHLSLSGFGETVMKLSDKTSLYCSYFSTFDTHSALKWSRMTLGWLCPTTHSGGWKFWILSRVRRTVQQARTRCFPGTEGLISKPNVLWGAGLAFPTSCRSPGWLCTRGGPGLRPGPRRPPGPCPWAGILSGSRPRSPSAAGSGLAGAALPWAPSGSPGAGRLVWQ